MKSKSSTHTYIHYTHTHTHTHTYTHSLLCMAGALRTRLFVSGTPTAVTSRIFLEGTWARCTAWATSAQGPFCSRAPKCVIGVNAYVCVCVCCVYVCVYACMCVCVCTWATSAQGPFCSRAPKCVIGVNACVCVRVRTLAMFALDLPCSCAPKCISRVNIMCVNAECAKVGCGWCLRMSEWRSMIVRAFLRNQKWR